MKVAKSVLVTTIYCLGLLSVGTSAVSDLDRNIGIDRAIVTITSTTTGAATTVAVTQSSTSSPTATHVSSAASTNVYLNLGWPLYLAFAVMFALQM
ncbi:hypothetical protein NQZ79_g6833 [Umbelopsis isabellina]|nr:hypothetical protein NQZ79_g6833 [Umbelopsis isabellina]